MTSKKRWKDIYSEKNPFQLPQNIARQIRVHSRKLGKESPPERIRYLWIYVSDDCGVEDDVLHGQEARLSVDEWLNIVDESATLGAENLIISMGNGLAESPEVIEMAAWAQSAHQMFVGLHVYRHPLTEDELKRVADLDPERTKVFVDSDLLESMPFAESMGVTLHVADGKEGDTVHPTCRWPEDMTCIGPHGQMYTCGLVLGEDQYLLGHCFERRLDNVVGDKNLPHIIPAGVSRIKRRCNGCPPLMEQVMRGEGSPR